MNLLKAWNTILGAGIFLVAWKPVKAVCPVNTSLIGNLICPNLHPSPLPTALNLLLRDTMSSFWSPLSLPLDFLFYTEYRRLVRTFSNIFQMPWPIGLVFTKNEAFQILQSYLHLFGFGLWFRKECESSVRSPCFLYGFFDYAAILAPYIGCLLMLFR